MRKDLDYCIKKTLQTGCKVEIIKIIAEKIVHSYCAEIANPMAFSPRWVPITGPK